MTNAENVIKNAFGVIVQTVEHGGFYAGVVITIRSSGRGRVGSNPPRVFTSPSSGIDA